VGSPRRMPGDDSSWHAADDGTAITLRPFLDIGGESYSTYQKVMPA
jgi:hypothetical protein